MTTKVSCELYRESHLIWKKFVKQLSHTVDLHWSIQPLTKAAVTAGEKQGGNILGLNSVPQSCEI